MHAQCTRSERNPAHDSPDRESNDRAEAVADIEDGASVGIAGFGLSHRYPSTLISALGEKGRAG